MIRQMTAAVLCAVLLAGAPVRRGAELLSPEFFGDLSHSIVRIIKQCLEGPPGRENRTGIDKAPGRENRTGIDKPSGRENRKKGFSGVLTDLPAGTDRRGGDAMPIV